MDYEIYDLCDVKNPMDMNIELKEIIRHLKLVMKVNDSHGAHNKVEGGIT